MAKAVDTTDEIVTHWSGKGVDADRIEHELARLRYEAAGRPERGHEFALRTSFINLVIYANDEETARHAARTVGSLSSHHPSRAVIVIARPAAEEHRIDTELTAHCHISPGMERQVCCEEVTLTVNGPAAGHLHSVLAPLLIPDLPIYLWWIGELPHDHHLFSELMATADRFVVDSGRFTHPATDLPRLEHLSSRAPKCALGDLNWQRLQPWRQVIAQQCAAPSMARLLPHLTSATFTFAREQDGVERWSQALLMSGWVSDRFGLDTATVEKRDVGRATLKSDGSSVNIRMLASSYPRLAPGELGSIELRFGDGENKASIEVTRKADPLHLSVTIHEPEGVIEEHQRIDSGDERLMLARELDALTHDPQYHDVLRLALPFVAAIE